MKQLWARKTRLQFRGKQAGPRVRMKKSGAKVGGAEKDKKANPEIWSLARAEILPSAFSYHALGNEKKKLMKGKQASEPLKLCSLAVLRKALENRGVT